MKKLLALILSVLMLLSLVSCKDDKPESSLSPSEDVSSPVSSEDISEDDSEDVSEDNPNLYDGRLKGYWQVYDRDTLAMEDVWFAFNEDRTGSVRTESSAATFTFTVEDEEKFGDSYSGTVTILPDDTSSLVFSQLFESYRIKFSVWLSPESAEIAEYACLKVAKIPEPFIPSPEANPLEAKILGSWDTVENGIPVAYTFNPDGTGSLEALGQSFAFSYELLDGGFKVAVVQDGITTTNEMRCVIDGDTMTTTDPDGISYTLTRHKEMDEDQSGDTEPEFTYPAHTPGTIYGAWSMPTEDSGILMDVVFVFCEDGTGYVTADNIRVIDQNLELPLDPEMLKDLISVNFTFRTEGSLLYLTEEGEDFPAISNYAVDGDTLTLTDFDGEAQTFTLFTPLAE